jgi:hypothetical protein
MWPTGSSSPSKPIGPPQGSSGDGSGSCAEPRSVVLGQELEDALLRDAERLTGVLRGDTGALGLQAFVASAAPQLTSASSICWSGSRSTTARDVRAQRRNRCARVRRSVSRFLRNERRPGNRCRRDASRERVTGLRIRRLAEPAPAFVTSVAQGAGRPVRRAHRAVRGAWVRTGPLAPSVGVGWATGPDEVADRTTGAWQPRHLPWPAGARRPLCHWARGRRACALRSWRRVRCGGVPAPAACHGGGRPAWR